LGKGKAITNSVCFTYKESVSLLQKWARCATAHKYLRFP